MSEPTDEDWAAAGACASAGLDGAAPYRYERAVAAIAAALATEREKARAPFVALADEATRRLDWHIMVFDRGEARYVPLAELRRALGGGQPIDTDDETPRPNADLWR